MPSPSIESVAADTWPALPLDEWRGTFDTLHMWTQVVGKLALGLSPLTNHYWNTALQITPRGLATLPLTVDRRLVTLTFDFVSHQLGVECSDGGHTTVSLEPRPVAEFYRLVMDALARLDVRVRIWTRPAEVPNPIRFEADTIHHSYDPAAARALLQVLVQIRRVLDPFRARFPRRRDRPGRRELRYADARVDPAIRGGAARSRSGCRSPRVRAEYLRGGSELGQMGARAPRALAHQSRFSDAL